VCSGHEPRRARARGRRDRHARDREGYDGKGQKRIDDPSDAASAWDELGGRTLLVDRRIAFARELSIVAARSSAGEIVFYPLAENRHEQGILRVSRSPDPPVAPELERIARGHATRLLERLGYVGVLAIELFEVDGSNGPELLANEFAPRVHNTGHWTIDGAATSQFENHVRAVLDLGLGATDALAPAWAMVYAVGGSFDAAAVAAFDGAHMHWYGKDPRPGRKVGHVNVVARGRAELARAIAELERLVPFVAR
jgi:5-(carboxyamino)imidazole ribonucleotide synthase